MTKSNQRITRRTSRRTSHGAKLVFSALAAAVCATPVAQAATKTWDLDSAGHNNSQVNNGGGTWDTASTSNWTLNAGVANTTWAASDDAIFGGNPGIGAAGTISLSGTVDANSVTFNPAASGTFALTGGTLNLTSATGLFASASASIASTISGSAGLTKGGASAITLTAGNSVSGAVVVNNGVLSLSGSSGALGSASGYTINNGGTLRLDNSVASGGNHSSNNRLATAPITLNGGTLDFINNGTSSSETSGSLTAAQDASTMSFSGAGTSALSLGAFSRTAGASLNFTNLGAFNHTITFSSGVTAGNAMGQGVFVDGVDYAVYDSGGFVRAMTAGIGTNFYATTMTTGRHVKLSASFSTGNGTTDNFLTLNLAGATVGATWGNNWTLTLTNGGIIKSGGGASAITVGNNSSITSVAEYVVNTVQASDVLTISAPLGGSAIGLTKTGLGTLVLNKAASYTGTTTVAQGTLKNGVNNAFPKIPMVVGGGATWDLSNFDNTVSNLTLRNGATISTSSGTSKVTLDGNTGTIAYTGQNTGAVISIPVDLATGSSATHNITVADGAGAIDLNMSGIIDDGNGSQGITKLGAGTLRLGATNAYTGATTITAGTLQLDGSTHASSAVAIGTAGTLTGAGTVNGALTVTGNGVINFSSGGLIGGTVGVTGGNWNGVGGVTGITTVSSGTYTVNGTMGGAGAVNVNSTAKLAGTGTLSKPVAINTGGTISPAGDGANTNVGAIATGAHTWGTNSTYVWEIKDATAAAGTGYDTINVTGALTINATNVVGNKMVIKLVSHGAVAGWNPGQQWNWDIATASSISGFAADKFVLDTTDFADDNASTSSLFQVSLSGTHIRVSYVPEPATASLLGISAIGLLRRRRRV